MRYLMLHYLLMILITILYHHQHTSIKDAPTSVYMKYIYLYIDNLSPIEPRIRLD